MLESKEAFRHRQIFKMKIWVETLNTQFDTNEVTKSMSSTSNTVTTLNIFILESNEKNKRTRMESETEKIELSSHQVTRAKQWNPNQCHFSCGYPF